MKPLSLEVQNKKKNYKIIQYRPFPESGIRQMGMWIQSKSWREIYAMKCPNKKAKVFEEILMDKINTYFPIKSLKLNEDDKPWVDAKLLKLDRLRKREYSKRKKSEKWVSLNSQFLERAEMLKKSYYENVVEDLKT